MKLSIYKSYDDLPLFLNARTVANVLGVSISSAYELMHEPDFPTLKVGAVWQCPGRLPAVGGAQGGRCEMRKSDWTRRDPIKNYFPPPQ